MTSLIITGRIDVEYFPDYKCVLYKPRSLVTTNRSKEILFSNPPEILVIKNVSSTSPYSVRIAYRNRGIRKYGTNEVYTAFNNQTTASTIEYRFSTKE